MVLRTRSQRDCWDGQVAALVNSSPVLRSHVSVAPLWTDSRSVWAIRRLATWRQTVMDLIVRHSGGGGGGGGVVSCDTQKALRYFLRAVVYPEGMWAGC